MHQIFFDEKEKQEGEPQKYVAQTDFLYSNITPLIDLINSKEEKITNEELAPYLDKYTDPWILAKQIREVLEKHNKQNPSNKSVPTGLLFRKLFMADFFITMFLDFMLKGLQFMGVMMLDRTTEAMRIYGKGTGEKYEPIFYLIGMMMCYLISSYIQSKYDNLCNLFMLRIQITGQFLLYNKALNTKCFSGEEQQSEDNSKQDKNKNKSEEQESQHIANINVKIFNFIMQTLMTADVDQIMFVQWALYEGQSSFAIIILLMWMLFMKAGPAALQSIYIFLIAQVYNLFCSFVIMVMLKRFVNFQMASRSQYQYKDKRVELSSDVIDGIKQIKYLSWEETFSDRILAIRKHEFKMLAITKCADGMLSIFWNSISYILLYFYLTNVFEHGQSLTDLNVFTVITIFNTLTQRYSLNLKLLSFPIGILPWAINQILASRVSYKRAIDYLNVPEIDQSVVLKLEYPEINQKEKETVINIQEAQFIWPLKQKNDKKESLPQNKVEDDQMQQNLLVEEQKSDKFSLKIENLEIKQNTLNFIVGRIGSGKTALMNGILNELDKRQKNYNTSMINQSFAYDKSFAQSAHKLQTITSLDKILIRGSVAYVSQNTWLQNQTIRENILFGKEFNKEWYKKCLVASELVKDLHTFEKRDLYGLGPDGKNVSGGQKQRIALARALYQDCDIYLFDDVFSSLDVHVADSIFKKAILDLLIGKGKTVLLITSHYRYLNQVTKDDVDSKIIFIDDGQISKDETKMKQFIQSESQKEEEELQKEQEREQKLIREQTEADDDEKMNVPKLVKQQTSYADKVEEAINPQGIKKNQDESEEDREEGQIDSSTIKMYFSSMSWIIFASFVITNFATQGSMTLVDFWLKAQVFGQEIKYFFNQITPGDHWLNRITEYFNNDFTKTFRMLITFSIVITSLRAVFYVSCNLLSAWRIFKRLNNSVLKSKMKFFDQNNQGRILNRLQNDTVNIDSELPWFLHVFGENLSRTIGIPIGIIILFPWVSVVIIIQLSLIYLLSQKFRKSNRDLKRIASVNDGRLLGYLNETLVGLKTIRAFEQQAEFVNGYIQRSKDAIITNLSSKRCLTWFTIRLLLLGNLVFFCVGASIAILILLDYELDYQTFALALAYSVMIIDAFSGTTNLFTGLEQNMISVERVRQYFKNPQENIHQRSDNNIQKWNHAELEKQNNIEIKQEPINVKDYSVVFQNVFLTYEERKNDKEALKFALKNITLSIKKGEKIAFVGRTGSGKTSILNILFRLYDLQYGKIYIEGKDTDELSLFELRSMMSVVPQFGFLFNGTLKENIDPQNLVSSTQIEQIFNSTGFKIRGINNEEVEGQDAALNTTNIDFQIAKSGSNLSNGEKQVINFLRTIIQNKQIVCLDEATSNMDPKTDEVSKTYISLIFQLLHKLLFEFAQQRTLLVITHRLENIHLYDRIVVMDKGQIVEVGSYEELTKIEGGFFYQLVNQH